MSTTKRRGFLEMDRVRSLARALGCVLVDCGDDRWALEHLDSPGAGRWPTSGSETWENILRVLRRRNQDAWD